MKKVHYIDRISGQTIEEKIFWGGALGFLYGDSWLARLVGRPLSHFLARCPWVSRFCGYWQSRKWSARHIQRFVDVYEVDSTEFADSVDRYRSFNDFFIRKLKPEARLVAADQNVAIIPADGRYYFYQELLKTSSFIVKDARFDLASFLQDEVLAKKYEGGSMAMARLCPTDYHRFHFPVDGMPGRTRVIKGSLYSVNPMALHKNLKTLWSNKRTYCRIQSERFGEVLFCEIGATNVGTIHQTYQPLIPHSKGDEKGYFSFGGSALIVLFQPNSIAFDRELLEATAQGLEVRCLMGQSMGKASSFPR